VPVSFMVSNPTCVNCMYSVHMLASIPSFHFRKADQSSIQLLKLQLTQAKVNRPHASGEGINLKWGNDANLATLLASY
jgi:hypothetical protein